MKVSHKKSIKISRRKQNIFVNTRAHTTVLQKDRIAPASAARLPYNQFMKSLLPKQKSSSFVRLAAITALLGLSIGLPLSADAYQDPFVKKVKVKQHKVKVKTIGGKAKIKNRFNGSQRVKVRGFTGMVAHTIASDLSRPHFTSFTTRFNRRN